MTAVSPTTIAERVVEAILAQKLSPGERLGEQALADNFSVSRTLVREALMQLQALKRNPALDYVGRARVDARIEAITPTVLELRRQGVQDPDLDRR